MTRSTATTPPQPAKPSALSPSIATLATGKTRLSWTESSADKHTPTKKPGVCKDTVAIISEPVEQNSYGLSDGAWMKDARGHGNVIYLTNGHYGNSLLEFRDLDTFRSGEPSNSYELPYSYTGSGHVGFHQEVIVLTRLRPRDLQPIHRFRTGLRRGRYGDSFLVCGVLYAVDSVTRHHANVTYAFDTHTLTHTVPTLALSHRYAHTSQLSYCPLDRKLYAWDHAHQLTYDLIFAY
ncbi:hypothetical protein CRUP_030607 [Coryphaenoides rupestris]|nr:hypothetical protein CRUP_030607 [Coryphaenoides rupestris]